MSSPNQYLNNLRNKPQSTKNAIAAVFALMPALLVGYAQFYMNANNQNDKVAESSKYETFDDQKAVSAMASIGKIFTEGKKNIGSALDDFDKIDEEILKSTGITEENMKKALSEIDQSSTNTKPVIDKSKITNTTE